MLKAKLIKKCTTSPIFTDINNTNSNININQLLNPNFNFNNEANINNILKNFFIATTEFYKIFINNFNQLMKLLLILEKINNNSNNYIENNYYEQNYFNKNINDVDEKIIKINNIIKDLKIILSTNNSNLNMYYYDFKNIMKNIEIYNKGKNRDIIRSTSGKNRKVSVRNHKNMTIDNNLDNNYKRNNFNFSPINSFIWTDENKNTINNVGINKENRSIYSLFQKLKKFEDIIMEYSPGMKNNFTKIINILYNEFKKIEKQNKKNKIDLSIQNVEILSNNNYNSKSNRGNSYPKKRLNIYSLDEKENEREIKLKERLNIYKINMNNYQYKIDELQCQLEDLKTYSNTLEAMLEDKNNNDYNKIEQNNDKNKVKLKIIIQNNKKLIKSIENLNVLNTKLTEESNNKDLILKNKENIIKKLNLNNENLKNKIREYENNINLSINRENNNVFNYLKIIKNDNFYYANKNSNISHLEVIINEKDKEILSLKEQILKIDTLNNKLIEYQKENNNYKLLLNEKENKINIYKKEIKELKTKIEKINPEKKQEISSMKKYNSKNKKINEIQLSLNIENENEKKNKINIINNIANNNQEKNSNSNYKNDNLIKLNFENINMNEDKNKEIIRELNQDKLLLENELEEYKKKNEELSQEIKLSRQKLDNKSSINSINNSLKESYNKKVSKTHNDLIKKIKILETDNENKNQELEGLKNFIEKLQKEKENIILNTDNNINNNNNNSNEMKLIKENEKLKMKLEHLSSTFPKEMEELRKENEKLLNKYNNLKKEKNHNDNEE